MKGTLKVPNFFIVGGQKCGTTTLYGLLRQHPRVFLSDVKESHYYSHGIGGETFCDSAAKRLNTSIINNKADYLKLFAGANGRLIGEVCPSYLFSEHAAFEIFKDNPNAKIVIVLREQSERAFSAYLHMKARNGDSARSFIEAIGLEKDPSRTHFQPMARYIQGSIYAPQIARYIKYFERSNILLVDFNSLKNDPIATANKLLEFVNLESLPESVKVGQTNKTFVPDKSILGRAIIERPFWLRAIRTILPKNIRGKIFEKVKKRHSIKTETLSYEEQILLSSLFKSDKEELSKKYGIKF